MMTSPAKLLVALLAATAAALLLAAAPGSGAAEAAAGSGAPVWHGRLDAALLAAEESGEPILVDLYADWCGWCKKLEAEVFSHPRFADFAEDYVLLRVDVEDGDEGSWLRERLGVRRLPTLAIIDADLVRIGLVDGYAPVGSITARISGAVESYRTVREELQSRLEDDSLDTQLAVAEELVALQDGGAAAAVYRSLMARDDVSPAERAFMGVTLAEALRLARDYEAAGAALEDVRRRLAAVPPEEARSDVERSLDLASLRLAEELGECQQIVALEDFLAQRPESSYIPQVQDRLVHLRHDTADCSGT